MSLCVVRFGFGRLELVGRRRRDRDEPLWVARLGMILLD